MMRTALITLAASAALGLLALAAPGSAQAASYAFGVGYGGYGYSSGFASFHYRSHPSPYVYRRYPAAVRYYHRPYYSRSYRAARYVYAPAYYRRVYTAPVVYTEPVVTTERVVTYTEPRVVETRTVAEPRYRAVPRSETVIQYDNTRPVARNAEGRPQYAHSSAMAIPERAARAMIGAELTKAGLKFDETPQYEVGGRDLKPDFMVHDAGGRAIALVEYWSDDDARTGRSRLDLYDKVVEAGNLPVFFIQGGHRAAVGNEASGIARILSDPHAGAMPTRLIEE